MRKKITYVLVLSVIILLLAFSSTHPSAKSLTFPGVATPKPGLKIYGVVRLENGKGVPNVAIYRAYAAYQGIVVATTDANGHYQSDTAWIPGDEMIRVWAERPGFAVTPEFFSWRHYYGLEIRELDFAAKSTLDYFIYFPRFGSP